MMEYTRTCLPMRYPFAAYSWKWLSASSAAYLSISLLSLPVRRMTNKWAEQALIGMIAEAYTCRHCHQMMSPHLHLPHHCHLPHLFERKVGLVAQWVWEEREQIRERERRSIWTWRYSPDPLGFAWCCLDHAMVGGGRKAVWRREEEKLKSEKHPSSCESPYLTGIRRIPHTTLWSFDILSLVT